MTDRHRVRRLLLWPYVAVAFVFLAGAGIFAGLQWWRDRPPTVNAEVCDALEDALTSIEAGSRDDLTSDLQALSQAANRDDVEAVADAAATVRVRWAALLRDVDTRGPRDDQADDYRAAFEPLQTIEEHCAGA